MKFKEKNKIISDVVKILESGGTILYPTDTVWGIGCDATNSKAIKKIYSIKKREITKPLIILMDNTNLLKDYIDFIPKKVYKIIKTTTKPTSIIYDNPKNLPEILIHKNSIAIRIVKLKHLTELIKIFGKPITSTSANISGEELPNCLSQIDNKIKQEVDYIIPKNFIEENMKHKTSQLLKLNNNNIEIIRN